MNLSNKKTKKLGHMTGVIRVYTDRGWTDYFSLAKLNEEWEDYKPAEPLIKDEKIRKAVKAWAEACNLKHVTYKQASNEFYDSDTRGAFAIKFKLIPVEVYLEDGEHYTVAELCGEEK